ncbi:hypothetical protein DNU06_13275 [Putridiphycobacter roseus]|uniref:Tetratricopeptide repeat protein n=1 Tax=Putridiphycobacter roseus TaxID=2219161 RepID=A0A2W1MW00_9FLAO|nr:tetratricopeptide repeat protein [Putridiphycobacter roseus]PZE16279.1 hypothetical protein DNU06_13275 [Putridiphycobacter roseus]
MFKTFKLTYTVITIFALLIINACSTEKDAALNVGYHNMTARFNGYFNAGEIINQSASSFRNKYKEDYTQILALEVYPNEKEASELFPDMDKAIEKCSKVIYRHSMPDPNVVSRKKDEYCRWIDDNWFLIGKAHFYKREFDKAEEKFKYIIKEYNHAATKYAAKIWLAKIYIEQGDYSKANLQLISAENDMKLAAEEEKEGMFSFLKKSGPKKNKYQRAREKREKKKKKKEKKEEHAPEKFTDDLKKDYELTLANLSIKQENYPKAITQLEKAITLTKKRKERARYEYILGQLYQQLGKNAAASSHFNRVINSNAIYEMRFYAKINKALTANSNPTELRKDLNKMLKDEKNLEYRDQVYFVLADIDLREGNRAAAIVNLTKSAQFSVNNDKQKAKSYLKLADMHFEDKLYIKSQKYYDSCVTVLPKEHEDYSRIENKAKSLSSLVENYEVYSKEDSLQALVSLSEKDLEKELKNILKDIQEKARIKKITEKLKLEEQQRRLSAVNTVNGEGSKWYFYNQKSLAKGYNDFKLNWSSRELEDDWRRSNKQQSNEFKELAVDSTVVSVDSLTIDILMEGLPLSDEALSKSKDDQMVAMYNLGMIYKNQLSEEKEAIDYFQKILRKNYPHEKVLPAAYQLYLIEKLKGSSKQKEYENYIKTNFPNSDIANLISNPSYFEEKERIEQEDLLTYKKALNLYELQQYVATITYCNNIIFNDQDNKYLNKYYILKAKAISKTGIGGATAAIAPLEDLIALSPDSPEGIYAANYINQTNNGDDVQEKLKYKPSLTEPHYLIVLIPEDKENLLNEVKIKISNFNASYFNGDGIKIISTLIDETGQVILVKQFDNYAKAEVYKNAFTSIPAKSLLNNIASDYTYYLITKPNFSILQSTKNMEEYNTFYLENY